VYRNSASQAKAVQNKAELDRYEKLVQSSLTRLEALRVDGEDLLATISTGEGINKYYYKK